MAEDRLSPGEESENGPSSVPAPPLLTILAGLPVATYPLRLGATVAGRSSEADIPLPHSEVSRRHCRFHWDGAAVCTVEDLDSQWGTKVNGTPPTGNAPVPLQPGDQLQIGPVVALFGFQPPSAQEIAALLAAGGRAGVAGGKVLVGGREVAFIPLGEKRMRFGRGEDMDVVLAEPGVSRQHTAVERGPAGYEVSDLHSRAGSFVNGRRFETHRLVIGDQLQIGSFCFRFDGRGLVRAPVAPGVSIEASHLRKRVGAVTILDDFSLRIERGQFVMILGPSGAGKTSLLDALLGLRPADSGEVRIGGEDFSRDSAGLRSLVGYVPQEDIVHRELTVTEALEFSARLRLPAGTPGLEIRKLVAQTINRLGLDARRDTLIHQLSGGERKRVNVGVELLGSPAVLFLDEPTGGLDPAGEFKLMELLRRVTDSGCTTVCTTHVVENVYLADRLFVMAGGRLAFAGSSQEARDYFGVQKLTLLYDRLAGKSPAEWDQEFHRWREAAPGARETPAPADGFIGGEPVQGRRSAHPRSPLPVLLARQWTILCADAKNFLLLFGQPLVIALLVGLATDDAALALFFTYFSTLWFGCSNAAQEIGREIAVYRRERMVGLSRHAYLVSKFVLWGTLTAAQGIFLFVCLWGIRWFLYPDPGSGLVRGLDGSLPWYLGSVVGTAFAAVGIGFAVSALARSTMQAVMAVPLVLIPQILFSGLVVETNQMSSTVVYSLTRLMPSYAAQTLMDVGAFIDRPITGDLYNAHKKAGDHLRDLLLRGLVAHSPSPTASKGDLRALAAQAFRTGAVYRGSNVGQTAAFKLLGWTLLGYSVAWFALRTRERG